MPTLVPSAAPWPGVPIPEVALIAGTRAEAVRIAPVARALYATRRARPVIVDTGEQSGVAATLAAFELAVDAALAAPHGTPAARCGRLVAELDAWLARRRPSAVLIPGDTTSAVAGALAAFWRKVPVVHLEAGLRSYDLTAPFPEEAHRKLVGQLASLHLAPTPRAAVNLADEGIDGHNVLTVGSTVVDAALNVAGRDLPYGLRKLRAVEQDARRDRHKLLLVTVHRRRPAGDTERVLAAAADTVRDHADVRLVLVAHRTVRASAQAALGWMNRVTITDPLGYPDLVRLLSHATLVVSDSGGIAQEAPSFGVPVLIPRDSTEWTEAVESGYAVLAGDRDAIAAEAHTLLTHPISPRPGNPYGDGLAGLRVEQALCWLLGRHLVRPAPFTPSGASAA